MGCMRLSGHYSDKVSKILLDYRQHQVLKLLKIVYSEKCHLCRSCGAFVCIGEVCEEHGLSGGLEFRNRKAPGLDPGWEDQGGGTTIMGCQFFLAHETMEIKGLYMPPLFF